MRVLLITVAVQYLDRIGRFPLARSEVLSMSPTAVLVVTAGLLAAVRPATAGELNTPDARVFTVRPGPGAAGRLIGAVPGDTIQLEAGVYELRQELLSATDNITIRGRGHLRTILSFKNQDTGSKGIEATGDAFVIEHLAVEDTKRNAIKVLATTPAWTKHGIDWLHVPSYPSSRRWPRNSALDSKNRSGCGGTNDPSTNACSGQVLIDAPLPLTTGGYVSVVPARNEALSHENSEVRFKLLAENVVRVGVGVEDFRGGHVTRPLLACALGIFRGRTFLLVAAVPGTGVVAMVRRNPVRVLDNHRNQDVR